MPVPVVRDADVDSSTRDRVRELIVAEGPVEASRLAEMLDLTTAGVRRHLAALESSGQVRAVPEPASARRGRGRPAKRYIANPSAHTALSDASSDLAAGALRYLAGVAGSDAVRDFAHARLADLEDRYGALIEAAGDDPAQRTQALARALNADGYAASSRELPSGAASQLCQGHCPVQEIAAEFPQFCEAETEAFARLLGVHVQRLATLAGGGHVCTTHVPHSTTPTANELRPAQHGKDTHDNH